MVFRLKKGDLIDILAPGSFIDEEENFQKGIEILKNWGLEINENNSLSKKYGYFCIVLEVNSGTINSNFDIIFFIC